MDGDYEMSVVGFGVGGFAQEAGEIGGFGRCAQGVQGGGYQAQAEGGQGGDVQGLVDVRCFDAV